MTNLAIFTSQTCDHQVPARSAPSSPAPHREHSAGGGTSVRSSGAGSRASPAPGCRGGEAVRAILNRTFFTRLYVDARKVTGAEMREPLDVLHEAYRLYKTRTHHRTAPDSARSAMRSAAHSSRAPHDRSTLIDSLTSVFDLGWSKPIMVGMPGFEPGASCSQSERGRFPAT